MGLPSALAPGFQVRTKKQRGQGTLLKVQLPAGRWNAGTAAALQKGGVLLARTLTMARSGSLQKQVWPSERGPGPGPGSWEMSANRSRSGEHLSQLFTSYLTSVLVNTLIVKRKTRGSGHGPDGESGSSSFCRLVAGTCPQLSLILPQDLWSRPREQEGHYKTPGRVGTGPRGEVLTVLLAGDEGIQDARV